MLIIGKIKNKVIYFMTSIKDYRESMNISLELNPYYGFFSSTFIFVVIVPLVEISYVFLYPLYYFNIAFNIMGELVDEDFSSLNIDTADISFLTSMYFIFNGNFLFAFLIIVFANISIFLYSNLKAVMFDHSDPDKLKFLPKFRKQFNFFNLIAFVIIIRKMLF
jgi:hypothetical protein